jgi:hypothetical protein
MESSDRNEGDVPGNAPLSRTRTDERGLGETSEESDTHVRADERESPIFFQLTEDELKTMSHGELFSLFEMKIRELEDEFMVAIGEWHSNRQALRSDLMASRNSLTQKIREMQEEIDELCTRTLQQ